MVNQLAAFVVGIKYADLSVTALGQEKIQILDALDSAIGALDGESIKIIQSQIQDFDGEGRCWLIGGGRRPLTGQPSTTRLVRLFSKRFAVQERIGQQIADTLDAMLHPYARSSSAFPA